jgi:two-component sensor histidine kinase
LLDPFEHPGCRIATGDVAEVEVIQAHADALALVLGELAVNSSKHGALSGTGEIAVRAQLAGEDFTVIWDEHSNRPVASHARTGGQGLRLMQRILAARRGAIDIDWHEHGLTATVRLPLG